MKLLIKTDTDKIYDIKPKDIRRYIGNIVDKQYEDKVLWHERKPPAIIYPKTFKGGFEIVNYTGDRKLMYHIWEKIEKNREIKLNGISCKVVKVRDKEEEYEIPKKGLYFYKTRTPIILSANPIEYKIVYATATKEDLSDFNNYVKYRIINDIKYKLKHYFDIDFNKLDDLNLIIKKEDIRLVEVKEGEKKRQAVWLTFASNYSLPRFVGYANGLGWGELIMQKI